MQVDLPFLKPRPIGVGSTIGIFTPSSPAYVFNPGLFENALKNLRALGFNTKLGGVTAKRASQGYRSATPKERANEFMQLVLDDSVDVLMSTIGGANSSSMIPYLDFAAIRKARKPICGFSDVTSLHLAVLKHARLKTFYSPSTMCWFGDWPDGVAQSNEWFLDAITTHAKPRRLIVPPKEWSNHKRRWDNDEWKTLPREWLPNPGWKALREGTVEGEILALNLNTLMCAAGTNYWPDLKGKILLIEEMYAPLSRVERSLNQLMLMGVFQEISALIVGKPEIFDSEGASFGFDELLVEIAGHHFAYPVVTQFDCSHTLPMLTVPQLCRARLQAVNGSVEFEFLESGVEA